jgi:glucokinase
LNLLGIDIGGTNTKVVLLSPDDEVIERGEIPTRAVDGPEALALRLDELVAHWPESAGAGFSVAGLMNLQSLIVQAPNLAAFVGVDLAGAFESFGVLALENDVNCAVFGEWKAGAGQGTQHLAMLSLGTGVGGGLILAGELYRGAGGIGAELGHMTLDPDGPECPCGLPGHVESWLGSRGFVEAGRAYAAANPGSRLANAVAAGDEPDARLLTGLAQAGCDTARAAIADRGRWLGIACANIVAVLQPDLVLVAGGSARCGELLFDPALEEYDRRCMEAARGTVEVRPADLGVESAAIGAALLARANLDADRARTR